LGTGGRKKNKKGGNRKYVIIGTPFLRKKKFKKGDQKTKRLETRERRRGTNPDVKRKRTGTGNKASP